MPRLLHKKEVPVEGGRGSGSSQWMEMGSRRGWATSAILRGGNGSLKGERGGGKWNHERRDGGRTGETQGEAGRRAEGGSAGEGRNQEVRRTQVNQEVKWERDREKGERDKERRKDE